MITRIFAKPFCVLWIVTLILKFLSLQAADLFTYQGKLANAQGAPLEDGLYRLGVRIWDEANGGTKPLWAKKYDVPVVSGVFSLMIGAEGLVWNDPEPLTESLKLAVSGTGCYLEITVMSEANGTEKAPAQWQVLAPRQALNVVPYALNGVPSGTVVPFAGTVIPEGWVLCDGSLLDGGDPLYASLFAAIQTTYGAGEGAGFRVPDLRGRVAVGAGQGSGLTPRIAGTAFGEEMHHLTIDEIPYHDHGGLTSENGNHTHTTSGRSASDDGGGPDTHFALGDSNANRTWPGITINSAGSHRHTISPAGGDQPHNNMQPSLVLNYIIKL